MVRPVTRILVDEKSEDIARRIRNGENLREVSDALGIDPRGFTRYAVNHPAIVQALVERIEALLTEKPSRTINQLASLLGLRHEQTTRLVREQGINVGKPRWMEHIKKDYPQKSARQIALELGVDPNTIQRLVNEMGIQQKIVALHKHPEFQKALREMLAEDHTRSKSELADALTKKLAPLLDAHYGGKAIGTFHVKRGKAYAINAIKAMLNTKTPPDALWTTEDLRPLTVLWGKDASESFLERVQRLHAHDALDYLYHPQVPTPMTWDDVRRKLAAQQRKKGYAAPSDLTVADVIEAVGEHVWFHKKIHGGNRNQAARRVLEHAMGVTPRQRYTNWGDARQREKTLGNLLRRYRKPLNIPPGKVPHGLVTHYTGRRRNHVEALAELLDEFRHVTPEQKRQILAQRSHERRIRIILQHLDPHASQAAYMKLTGMSKSAISQSFRKLHNQLQKQFADVDAGKKTLAEVATAYNLGVRGMNELFQDYQRQGRLQLWRMRGAGTPAFRDDMVPLSDLLSALDEHRHAFSGKTKAQKKLSKKSTVSVPDDLSVLENHLRAIQQKSSQPHDKMAEHIDAAQALCRQFTAKPPHIRIQSPSQLTITRRLNPKRFEHLNRILESIRHEHRFLAA